MASLKTPRGRRRRSNRPRILRFRWRLMTRSRHGRQATVLFLAVALVLAFAFLRRFAAPREEPTAPSAPAS